VSSKGLSSVALGRHLCIGQKTAWFLGQRIRAMMADDPGLLRGIVEADETYGGKRKRGQKSKRDGDGDQPKGRGGRRKAMVVTAVERGGKARAKRGGTHSERTIATFLFRNVSLESVLSTDELPAYRWIGRKFRAQLRVNHSAGEYVRNDANVAAKAHSSTGESWNATFKRAINGVWHWISIKHLDRYCTQTAFRWRHRDHDARLSPLLGGNVGRAPWKVLSA